LQRAKHENQLIFSKILASHRRKKGSKGIEKIIGNPKPDPQQDKQLVGGKQRVKKGNLASQLAMVFPQLKHQSIN